MTEDPAGDNSSDWWNQAYAEDETSPWETSSPQPTLVELEDFGDIAGRVLDVGCGVGTHALYLAKQGHSVFGVDFAPAAIERARKRVADESTAGTIRFESQASTAPGINAVVERTEL